MELRQLRYFQKVAELENITLAARHFMIPQPSMSQTISRLEKELKVKLFDRKNGKLFLNEQGRTFLAHVERVLQELDDGVASVTETDGSISGSVRIKVMENHRFILTCVPQFIKLYPNVNISVSHGYYEDPDIPYDLCVSSNMTYKRMTAQQPLIREQVVLAVHEAHPLAQKQSISIADLRGQRLISLPPQSALHAITLELCRGAGDGAARDAGQRGPASGDAEQRPRRGVPEGAVPAGVVHGPHDDRPRRRAARQRHERPKALGQTAPGHDGGPDFSGR